MGRGVAGRTNEARNVGLVGSLHDVISCVWVTAIVTYFNCPNILEKKFI